MRLCFLYRNKYAPYSKWFGTGFKSLNLPDLENVLEAVLSANTVQMREKHIVAAQMKVAQLHNDLMLTEPFTIEPQKYFGRNIEVLFVDKLAELVRGQLSDEVLKSLPLIGALSQVGNFVTTSDNPKYNKNIQSLYKP